jgi:hypothetical protein
MQPGRCFCRKAPVLSACRTQDFRYVFPTPLFGDAQGREALRVRQIERGPFVDQQLSKVGAAWERAVGINPTALFKRFQAGR